jgi:hypothetical protein
MSQERKCLGAYTEAGPNYPPYVSINQTAPESVEITLRAPRKPDGNCGDTVQMTMPADHFAALLEDLTRRFRA